ncbi:hypothetical protein GDO81_007611 [Engystomops pustulosus]|uniref:Uncharacterized protein n=1 Tax=Engystomops pustulosus TaxID=76066 RepID=A0AAV7C8K9_ENGPU|nr:hypothetical protein GDO81_007611 [Engystomops pustulosus]
MRRQTPEVQGSHHLTSESFKHLPLDSAGLGPLWTCTVSASSAVALNLPYTKAKHKLKREQKQQKYTPLLTIHLKSQKLINPSRPPPVE